MDDDDFQEPNNGKKKCRGCNQSFTMLSLLVHVKDKENIDCKNSYGKGGYNKLMENASKGENCTQTGLNIERLPQKEEKIKAKEVISMIIFL